ncbi:MAG: cell division protein FtsX, partial [Ilumatobacteraceae bacterium]
MLARISYALRETFASLRRNVTLTAAAIVTSAVSLLLVGSTFLIQRAFDNLLTRWKGDVELIVYIRSDASVEQIQLVEDALRSQPSVIDIDRLRYLDQAESYGHDEESVNQTTPNTDITDETTIDLTDGPLASRYEAATEYIIGWIDSRLRNLWKSNSKNIKEQEDVVDLVDSSGESEVEDDEDS